MKEKVGRGNYHKEGAITMEGKFGRRKVWMQSLFALLLLTLLPLPFIQVQGGGEDVWEQKVISMDFKDEDLTNILRIIADEYNLNIIAGKEVSGKVTVSFSNVNLGNALDTILRVNGFQYVTRGNIIWIIPLVLGHDLTTQVFSTRYVDASKLVPSLQAIMSKYGRIQVASTREGEKPSVLIISEIPSNIGNVAALLNKLDTPKSPQEFETRVFNLQYVEAKTLLSPLKKVLSPQGDVQAFTPVEEGKSNVLVVTDVPDNMPKVAALIKALDVKPPQVMIEARIMDVSLEDIKELGIEWKYYKEKAFQVGWGIDREDYIRLLMEGKEPGATAESKVPELMDTGWLFSQGTLKPNEYFFIIKALESKRDVKTLSHPQITTQDKKEAEIFVGRDFPVPTYTYNKDTGTWEMTGTETVKEGITFRVTPQVNVSDRSVTLKIEPEVSGPVDYKTDPASGRTIGIIKPTTTTRTEVTVPDSHTMVIAGLINNRNQITTSKIPFLGDIPILGNLFKSRSPVQEKRELVIFVTPHILTEEISQEMTRKAEKRMKKKMEGEKKIRPPRKKVPTCKPMEEGNKGYIIRKGGEGDKDFSEGK